MVREVTTTHFPQPFFRVSFGANFGLVELLFSRPVLGRLLTRQFADCVSVT